jgi:tRNA pseudouridine55 synthase
MARRKKGRAISGWLVLDKPASMTSTQAVGIARRLFDAQKAGHAGTLDPLATGVLPIAFGEATKTVPYAVDGEKRYRFTVRWGIETDTDDAEGRDTATSDIRPEPSAIEALLPHFIGEIMQQPPAFSAIKVDGARAYDLARAGAAVELQARPVHGSSLTLAAVPDANSAGFEATCGKGTYVRALARDMGRALRCFGHVIALRRTRVGGFDEQDAVSLEQLEAAAQAGPEAAESLLQPIEAALSALMSFDLARKDAARLLQGQPVIIRGRDAPAEVDACYAMCGGQLVALSRIQKGQLLPLRVFNFRENPGS